MTKKEQAIFLGKLIPWCIKWGCTVRLSNKMQYVPDSYVFIKRKEVVLPEIIFSQGDRHISICGNSWEDLLLRLEYDYKRIYMELSVPMLGEDK